MNDRAAHATTGGKPWEQRLTTYWDRFGDIVSDYLGIPYLEKGRAVGSVTGLPTGQASSKKGLVCTSFVDVVLSRYLHADSADFQFEAYKFDKDIFDERGMKQVDTKIAPLHLADVPLTQDRVYGIVFHLEVEWVKVTANKDTGEKERVTMEPGSRIHVGFLAFHNNILFLIHASGPGVHIVKWTNFLGRFGDDLGEFGGRALRGKKSLSVYTLDPSIAKAPRRRAR